MAVVRRVLSLVLCCVCITAWSALAHAAAGPSGPAANHLSLRVDMDGDGNYQLAADYSVSYDDAVRAFAAAGGAPAGPGEQALNAQQVEGVKFTGPQSWNSFVQFLDQHYRSSDPQILTQSCDATISVVTSDISRSVVCSGAAADCPPNPDNCAGFYVSATARYQCMNDPPCPGPGGKAICKKLLTRVSILAFSSSDANGNPCTVCQCDFDNLCSRNGGCDANGQGIIHQGGTACGCGGAFVPGLGSFGLVLLTILLVVTAVWMMRKRLATGGPAAA